MEELHEAPAAIYDTRAAGKHLASDGSNSLLDRRNSRARNGSLLYALPGIQRSRDLCRERTDAARSAGSCPRQSRGALCSLSPLFARLQLLAHWSATRRVYPAASAALLGQCQGLCSKHCPLVALADREDQPSVFPLLEYHCASASQTSPHDHLGLALDRSCKPAANSVRLVPRAFLRDCQSLQLHRSQTRPDTFVQLNSFPVVTLSERLISLRPQLPGKHV